MSLQSTFLFALPAILRLTMHQQNLFGLGAEKIGTSFSRFVKITLFLPLGTYIQATHGASQRGARY